MDYFSTSSSFIVVSLLFVVTNGCSSSNVGIPAVDTSSIPHAANEILLYSERDPDDYIVNIGQRLETLGFLVLFPDERKISTRRLRIGRQLALTIYVSTGYDASNSATIARFSGIYVTLGGSNYLLRRWGSDIASWNSTDDNDAYAFWRLAEYVQQIEHERLAYGVSR